MIKGNMNCGRISDKKWSKKSKRNTRMYYTWYIRMSGEGVVGRVRRDYLDANVSV